MCPTGTSLHTTRPTTTSSSSLTNLRSAFDVLDADHDGKISRSDLQSFFGEYLGGTSQDGVIGSMITLADSNNDGFVEYHEFQKVLENNTNNNNINNNSNIMEDMFKVMDKDGDGKVGIEDLKSYLRLAGLDVFDDDVMAMVKLGGGGDGGVTYNGFLKILAV